MIKLANKYLLKYKNLLIIVTIISLLSSSIEVVFPYYISRFIDDVLIKKDINNLVNFVIIFSSISLFEIIFNYFSNVSFAKLQAKATFDFNADMIKRTQQLPLKFFQEHTASYLTQRINQDTYAIISFVLKNYINVTCNIILLFVITYLLIKINAVLFCVFCLLIVIYFLIYKFFKKRLKEIAAKNIEIQNKYISTQESQFKNIKFVKINVLHKFLIKKLCQEFNTLLQIIIKRTKIAYWFSTSGKITNNVFNVLIIVIGSIFVIKDKMTVGNFVILSAYFKITFSCITYFFNLGSDYQENLASYERILEILNFPLPRNGKSKIHNTSNIKLQNITFAYNDKIILDNLNLEFQKGKFYLVTGDNGIGKTTLLYLITGILSPMRGNIIINSENVENINMKYWRKTNVSYLEQEPTLLNDTVKSNLTLDINYSSSRLNTLIREIGLGNFFKKNHNINSVIDESSTMISGGEKQKISLVRTFLKKSSVILLDEPLSALDKNGIEKLKEILMKNKEEKIIICITHKQGLEDIADKIIDFNELQNKNNK